MTPLPNELSAGRQTGVVRLIVSVTELEQALTFYRDLLGLRLIRQAAGFAWLETVNGPELLLHERRSQASDVAVSIGFSVPGLDVLTKQWEAEGGEVVDQPRDQPWGERMAVVRDPDDHIVCLSQN